MLNKNIRVGVQSYLAALLLGLLLPLAFAPYSCLPFLYLSVAGFYVLIKRLMAINSLTLSLKKTILKAFALGWLYGLGWFTGVGWVVITLERFGGLHWSAAYLATFIFCGYLALFPAIVGGAVVISEYWLRKKYIFAGFWQLPLIFAHVFTLSEALRGWLFGGFPWLSLGYAQATDGVWSITSLSAFAPWVGWLGLTWFTVWSSALIVELLIANCKPFRAIFKLGTGGNNKASYLAIATTVVIIGLANAMPVQWTKPFGEPQTFQLIQGNINISLKWQEGQFEKNLQHYLSLMDRDKSIITLLPETALGIFDNPLSQDFINNWHGTLIAGAIERTLSGEVYNSVFATTPSSKPQFYRKHHLVPFGEYPLIGFAWFARMLSIPLANLNAGQATQKPLHINNIPIAVAICYENLFVDEWRATMNNAAFLINSSNTGWYGDSWAMPQHLQISHLRALEMQKPVLHVADTGISAVINAHGDIVNRIPALTSGSLKEKVIGYWGMTPYSRFGDWIIMFWIGLSFLALLLCLWLSNTRD